MRFNPKSNEELEKEAAAHGPFKPGIYDFDFIEAVDDISKAGNDMISVKIKVYDEQGATRTIRDWLLEAMAHKLKHACETCGLGREYENGEIEAADFLNRSGKVKIGIKDKFNNVVDYIPDTSAPKVAAKKATTNKPAFDDDDSIPF